MSETDEQVASWLQDLGIVDRPSGIEKARASRQWLVLASLRAFARGPRKLCPAGVLLGGLATRGIGLHDGAIAALETDNPFAAFTLIRSYAENAAALLYARDHPHKVERLLGLNEHPMPVGKLTAYANRGNRLNSFRALYSMLSQYAHPASKSLIASITVDKTDGVSWSPTPAFRPGNDFLLACAWIVEITKGNASLIGEFADSQRW